MNHMNFKIVCPLPVNLKIKITKTLFTVFELCSFLDKQNMCVIYSIIGSIYKKE